MIVPTYEISLKEQDLIISRLQRENQELKKQLEKKYEKVGSLTGELLYEENTKLINQQKAFIEYLENEIYNLDNFMKNIETSDKCHGDYPITYYIAQYKLQKSKEIFSKYKEIVGEKE